MDCAGRVEAGRLTEVAVYRRLVGASIERVWENVLDWEHLPWLHGTSFAAVELLASRPDGWRARVALQPAERRRDALIETHLDFARRRYLTLTVEGVGAGTEIWTDLEPRGDTTAIAVRFLLPDVAAADRELLAAAYTALYTRLWDEDEAMMQRRQVLLADGRRAASGLADSLSLGPVDELRARLPLVVELAGRSWRIVEVDGRMVVHATLCPHLLGPLDAAAVEAGCVRCPWHGYRFSLASRRCLEAPRLMLARPPRLTVEGRTGLATLGVQRHQ